MAKLSELPPSAQTVLKSLGSWKTVFKLVDELGWSQTECQKWIDALNRAGWLDSQISPDGAPGGGSATAYKRKETL